MLVNVIDGREGSSKWSTMAMSVHIHSPFSLSEADRKLVVIESFSDVVYLDSIPAFLDAHGSNPSSGSEPVDDRLLDSLFSNKEITKIFFK